MKKMMMFFLMLPAILLSCPCILEEAENTFMDGDYSTSYYLYEKFLIENSRTCSEEDFYIAHIGKTACLFYMRSPDAFLQDWYLVNSYLNIFPDEKCLSRKIKRNSLYYYITNYDVLDEVEKFYDEQYRE